MAPPESLPLPGMSEQLQAMVPCNCALMQAVVYAVPDATPIGLRSILDAHGTDGARPRALLQMSINVFQKCDNGVVVSLEYIY
jgi:hypothetical protein